MNVLFKSSIAILLEYVMCLLLAGFKSVRPHQSQQEKDEGYYWYEAIFLDEKEVEAAFRRVSTNYPKFDIVPDAYHVTTAYKPECRHERLYGSAVIIHITRYAYGSVQDLQENTVSENEGFLVEVSSPDYQMQHLLNNINRKWHITGSYTTGAKYTRLLKFSDAVPIDITISGVFGIGDSDGKITLK